MAKDANGKELKVGDVVRKVNNTLFSDGNITNIIREKRPNESSNGKEVWVKNGWISPESLILVEPPSPVREVTKKELVPGLYGYVDISVSPTGWYVKVFSLETKNDLKKTIETLQQIYEAV